MRTFLFIFLVFGQLTLYSQKALPTFSFASQDTMTFLQYFPVKADFILAYSEESYWWSNTENFNLLVRTGNTWSAWTYYKKWKSAGDVHDNNGKKKPKFFKHRAFVDSSAVKELFDSLDLINFWTLNIDSLNQTRGYDISDAVNYKFQLENPTGRQILESYAPEYFIKKYPDMRQRVLFLQSKDIFIRWWKRNTGNKLLLKAG
jgi:hypothetical protein